jgi:hypothetical protein
MGCKRASALANIRVHLEARPLTSLLTQELDAELQYSSLLRFLEHLPMVCIEHERLVEYVRANQECTAPYDNSLLPSHRLCCIIFILALRDYSFLLCLNRPWKSNSRYLEKMDHCMPIAVAMVVLLSASSNTEEERGAVDQLESETLV